jgi:tmRNA-binding protein
VNSATANFCNKYIYRRIYFETNSTTKREGTKLLLKKELKGLLKVFKAKGLTIVPLKLFTNEKDWQNYKLDFAKERKRQTRIPKRTRHKTRLRPNQKIILN